MKETNFYNADDNMTVYVFKAYNGIKNGYSWAVRLVDNDSGNTVRIRQYPQRMGSEAYAFAQELAWGKDEPISVNL
jgi:hypothetical protein